MAEFKHSQSGKVIKGLRLFPGARIVAGDLYESSNGTWNTCAGYQGILEQAEPIWIRPKGKLSAKAKDFLRKWIVFPKSVRVMRQNREGNFYYMSVPWFNWDGRVELYAVDNSEVIQELRDYGYVVQEFVQVRNPNTDYSTVVHGNLNETYALTETGREVAKGLLG